MGALTREQLKELARLDAAVATQLAAKPKRLAHTRRVAETAAKLACAYGVDEFDARAAGLLHDWSKALDRSQTLEHARALGIDLGVELELVEPLLHGMIAARELPERFPELDPAVFQAIDRHTLGAADMTSLDMVIFVADGIEPGRPDVDAIEAIRSKVGVDPLDELYFHAYTMGAAYVLETERYLYPGTLDIYNKLVLARAKDKEHA
jgi:predicted HD superfamily hydrolase involved in NAD metabolism